MTSIDTMSSSENELEDEDSDQFTERELIAQLGFNHIPVPAKRVHCQAGIAAFEIPGPSASKIVRSNNEVPAKEHDEDQDETRPLGLVSKDSDEDIENVTDDLNYIPPSDEEDIVEDEENVHTMNAGRKRLKKADRLLWKKLKNKDLRMKGKAYVGFSKGGSQVKDRAARAMGPQCKSATCLKTKTKHCNEFSEEERQLIYQHFWDELTWDQRRVFVTTMVDSVATVRNRVLTDPKNNRSTSLNYHLKKPGDGDRLRVCQTTFINTLSIGKWSVHDWVENSDCGMNSSKEKSYSTRPSRGTQSQAKIEELREFLTRLPKLPSHYCRHDTRKLYLEDNFKSGSDVFRAYQTVCAEAGKTSGSRWAFDSEYNKMNISIFSPKKDACDKCCEHEAGNLSDEDYQKHLAMKESARSEKSDDKKYAKEQKCHVITVDLEAVKIVPFLNASALYYKTKLCMHNYTVFDLNTRDASCYWWAETEADLTASSFVSCLLDYLTQKFKESNLPIIIWSDGCTYQNRNAILSNALLNFSIVNNVTIEQKILEKGHTQMECDSVHAAIERRLKNRIVNLPSDYINATKEARTKPWPYEAHHLNYKFFMDYTNPSFMRYPSIRPGSKAHDATVVDLRALKYCPNGTIQYKLKFTENYQDLPQRKKAVNQIEVIYPQLNNAQIKIKPQKYLHLQQLKSVLPRDCHAFYDELPH